MTIDALTKITISNRVSSVGLYDCDVSKDLDIRSVFSIDDKLYFSSDTVFNSLLSMGRNAKGVVTYYEGT